MTSRNLARCLIIGWCLATASVAGAQVDAKALRDKATSLRAQAAKSRNNAKVDAEAQKLTVQLAADQRAKGDNTKAAELEAEAKASGDRVKAENDEADKLEADASNLETSAVAVDSPTKKPKVISPDHESKVNEGEGTMVARMATETLANCMRQAASYRAFVIGQLAGKERYNWPNAPDFLVVSKEDLEKSLGDPEANLAKAQSRLDETKREYSLGKIKLPELEKVCYDTVIAAIEKLWNFELLAAVSQHPFLIAEDKRLTLQQESERNTLSYQLEQQYGYLSKERTDGLKAFDVKYSEVDRKLFVSLALRYQAEKDFLTQERALWAKDIVVWHNLATKLKRTATDVHALAEKDFNYELWHAFGPGNGTSNPSTLTYFLFLPGGVGDGYGVSFGWADWCKARPFPDIQTRDNPAQFSMAGILESPVAGFDAKGVTGRAEGAPKAIKP